MTVMENDFSFSTSRSSTVPDAHTDSLARSRAIVLSTTPGLAEMVARGLTKDGAVKASGLVMSLADFVAAPDLSLDEVAICLFEIKQGDDAQLAALRKLHAMGRGEIKILGVTSEVLTLATARALMDAGVDDVVPLGAMRPTLDDAAPLAPATHHAIANRPDQLRNGMIIGVAQTRGGIGATTFALNLATVLATKPKQSRKAKHVEAPRVAIVDLDLQNGTLGASIDIASNTAFVDMLRDGSVPDAAFLRAAMISHKAGFDVLAAPVEFVPLNAMRPEMMAALLDELRMAYDYIVLDMPRLMVEWLDPVLARADKVFLLSDTAVHSVRQARRMIDFYCEEHATLPLDVVVSLERKPFGTSAAVKEAEKFLNRKLTHWLPRDDRAAKQASDRGQPLLSAKPNSAIKKAMVPLTADIAAYFAANQRRQA